MCCFQSYVTGVVYNTLNECKKFKHLSGKNFKQSEQQIEAQNYSIRPNIHIHIVWRRKIAIILFKISEFKERETFKQNRTRKISQLQNMTRMQAKKETLI